MGKEAEPEKVKKLGRMEDISPWEREGEEEVDLLLIHPTSLDPIMPEQMPREERRFYEALEGSLSRDETGDSPWEPAGGLFYLAAIAEQCGLRVKVLDLGYFDRNIRKEKRRPIGQEDMKRVLGRVKAKFYGITTMTVQYPQLCCIAKIIKDAHPRSLLMAGGPHPTFTAKELLENCREVDIVVRGEGEATLRELLQQVQREGDLAAVRGITFRTPEGCVASTPNRPLLTEEELDELPRPAYHLLPRHLLPREAFPLKLRILGSRGCPGNCRFCSPRSMHGEIRERKANSIVDEIEETLRSYGGRFFVYGDLCLINNLVPQEIIRRGLDVRWWGQTRVDTVRSGQLDLDLLKRSGCAMLAVGIETANQAQADTVGKGINVEDSQRILSQIKDAGISTQAYLMIGSSGETHDTATKTLNFLESLLAEGLIDFPHLAITIPYPGTDVFANPTRYGYTITSREWSRFKMCCDPLGSGVPPYRTDGLSEEAIYTYWLEALRISTPYLERAVRKAA